MPEPGPAPEAESAYSPRVLRLNPRIRIHTEHWIAFHLPPFSLAAIGTLDLKTSEVMLIYNAVAVDNLQFITDNHRATTDNLLCACALSELKLAIAMHRQDGQLGICL